MTSTHFEQIIQELDFSFLTKKEQSGVLLTKDFEKTDESLATPDTLFALETAHKFGADAVYFRFFPDGRAAVPQLYFFDFTTIALTDTLRHQIHIRMWNGYQVPAYIILERSQVSIFDSRARPDEDKSTYANRILELTGQAIKSFNAKDFDDGLFWEKEENNRRFQFEQSSARDLIRGLKAIYKDFQQHSGLDKHVTLKLLVQSLLIKYLEERDEDSASGYFAGTYFKNNFKCNSFSDTIRNGKLLDLLDKLARDFNGKIFEWDKDTEQKEREAIQNTAVNKLADYLDGKSLDNQYVLWRLYSFSYLPVEVISSVYEELLTNSKDIVYTPEMIVSTLVDECMPLKMPQQNFKLIDVSCGSGIFLVKAYKRIVQWWRYEQWQKTGKLIKPSLVTLKELLLKSIHGIDIELDAVRLSIFSLALAILDEVDLDPPTWGKLRFPDLSENVLAEDFFKFTTENAVQVFDLVIGNPPFNLQPVNGKEPSRKKYFEKLKSDIGYKSAISIPDENPALHFLVQSMKLLKPYGLLCMIQPSGPLFYQKDMVFKQNIFSHYNLLQVIDLTKLADKLWGKTNVATAAIFLQNAEPDESQILHLIANRTFSNTNRLFLEFDHYDFHYISKEATLYDLYVWKCNLYGGGRINQLIEKISNFSTLGNYLKKKRKERGWVFGDGFIKGKADMDLTPSDFEKKKGGYSAAPYLTDSECFDPQDFNEKGIKKTYTLTDKFYQWKRQPKLFQGPLLLIKKNTGINSIPVLYTETSISFKNEIVGIHAAVHDKHILKNIENLIKNNNLFRFFLLLTSARSGISRSTSTLLQEDILNLPIPSDIEKGLPKLSRAENIVIGDVIKYQLSNGERELFGNSSKEQLLEFSVVFCQTLNCIYESQIKSFQLFKILYAGKYYALHFEYTDKKFEVEKEFKNDLEKYIQEIIPSKQKKEKTHIQRIIKAYGQDTIILVKPKQLRYWLPSIALRDADESFADYVKARYPDA